MKKQLSLVLGETVTSDFLRLWTEIVGYCLMNKIKPVLSNAKTSMFNSKLGVLSPSSELNVPFGGKQDYDYIIYVKNGCLPTVNMIVRNDRARVGRFILFNK